MTLLLIETASESTNCVGVVFDNEQLGCAHNIPDNFYAGRKTIPVRASVITHENSDFGVTSVTERSWTAPISKEEGHISDMCSHYTG